MHLVPRASTTTAPTPYVVPLSQDFDGNDGSWSTFKINVGTPGQDFRVQVSTKSGETWVIIPDGCYPEDGPDCPNLRGADEFESTMSPGFQINMSSTWSTLGQYSLDLEKSLDFSGNGIYGYDRLGLGPASDPSSLTLNGQIVAGVAEMDYYMGHIPLGIQSSTFSSLSQPIDSFLVQLWKQAKIPSLSYSYTAGAKYRLKSVFGSLILGGYDSTRFTSNSNNFSFSFSSDASSLLTVGVQSINALNSLQGTFSLMSDGHFSLIDSSVPHLWLPRAVCDNFETAFGLTYDVNTDLYLVNSTMHQKLQSLDPSITIKLGNTLSETGTNYTDIVLPYAAFDLQASYPIYPNATNYFPIRRAANDTQYVLGRTLLQEAYLIVDHERKNFTLAQAAFPDPLPSPEIFVIESPSNASSSISQSNSSLGIGGITGIAVGAVVLLILLLAGALVYFRKQRRTKVAELTDLQIARAEKSRDRTDEEAHELTGNPIVEIHTPNFSEMADDEFIKDLQPTMQIQELPSHHIFEMDGQSYVPKGTWPGVQ